MNLRSLLFVALLMAALIPVVFFGVWPHSRAFEKEVSDVSDRHLVLARNLGAALKRYDRDVKTTFRTLSLNLIAKTPLSGAWEMLENLNFRHICLARLEDGTIVDALDEDGALCPVKAPSKRFALFKKIASKDTVRFTNVLLGPEGKPVLYVVFIINELMAIGAIDTDYIVELGKAISFGERGHAAIIDHTGRVLAHPSPSWRLAMKDISDLDPVKRMLNRETGVSIFYSPALKEDMIAGFTWVPGPDWGVMIPQPLAELRARSDAVQRYALGVIVSGVLAAAVLSWFLSGYLARPVLAVVNAARQMAGGARNVRVPAVSRAAPREFKALRETFNTMAEANEEAHRKLTAVAEAVSSITGEKAFEHLVCSVAAILRADYVFIGELSPSDQTRVHTLAFCRDGEILENFDYSIIGAPCGNVIGQKTCVYSRDVQEIFHEDEGLRKMGVQCYVGIPLFDPDGVSVGLIVMMNREPLENTDIALDLLHILANRAAAELHRRTLETQLVQAQKMEAVGQLTGGVAHDFNNILGVIIGNLEFLEEELEGNENLLGLVNSATNAALKGANLNRQLLAFSRKQQLRPETIDLQDQVLGLLDRMQRIVGVTVQIELTQSRAPWTVKVDRALLENAILNLVTNAKEAMPDGGALKIDVTRSVINAGQGPETAPGDYVKMSMRDTGIGMGADVLAQIYEPFFTTKDVGKGSGLGLSMVFGFAKQSGGVIDIISDVGVGTVVNVYLPFSAEPPPSGAETPR